MKKFLLAAWALTLPHSLVAEVSLPQIFGDNMVLQCGKPVPVWGTAAPGEQVSVGFAGQTKTAAAGADGHWRVTLDSLEASGNPAELTVRGRNAIALQNVLVGEVWLCSGQSNMEKPLGQQRGQKPTLDFERELKAANFPEIRLLKVARARANAPATKMDGAWTACSPAALDAIKFSAAGYFFGRSIHRERNVPVGLIDATWGGTRIEPWTPPAGFAAVPALAKFAAASSQTGAKVEGAELSTLYNGMIAPLAPFALRGVIWYQGESNVIENDDGMRYADKMAALILGWRMAWRDDFSFYYVQIAPHLYHVARPQFVMSPEAEPRLWEAQTAAMQLPRTGMIVTTDLVDDLMDIHPRNKRDVGERLARWALARDYGRKDVVFSGPLFQRMEVAGNRAIISFDHAEGALASRDGKPLTWFVISGADGRFYPAQATIEGTRVSVSSPNVPEPKVVRFAWDEGARPNLMNKAGLPAAPFRTDAASWTPPQEIFQSFRSSER